MSNSDLRRCSHCSSSTGSGRHWRTGTRSPPPSPRPGATSGSSSSYTRRACSGPQAATGTSRSTGWYVSDPSGPVVSGSSASGWSWRTVDATAGRGGGTGHSRVPTLPVPVGRVDGTFLVDNPFLFTSGEGNNLTKHSFPQAYRRGASSVAHRDSTGVHRTH